MRRVAGNLLSALGFIMVALGVAAFLWLRAQEASDVGFIVVMMIVVVVSLLLFGAGHLLFLLGSSLTSGTFVRVLAWPFAALDLRRPGVAGHW